MAYDYYSLYFLMRNENICPHKYLYIKIHRSFIYNSSKPEITKWEVDKYIVVYPWNVPEQ